MRTTRGSTFLFGGCWRLFHAARPAVSAGVSATVSSGVSKTARSPWPGRHGACGARQGATFWLVLWLALLAASPSLAWAQPYAWVGNGSAGTVTVIDARTDAVAAVVPVGAVPGAVSAAADGSRAFVALAVPPSVAVLDGQTHTVLRTLALAAPPVALAASPDGSRIHVLGTDGNLRTLDAHSGAVLGTLALGVPGGLAVSPDGSRLLVAAGAVTLIDAATLTVMASTALGGDDGATQAVISPDGHHAWVAHQTGLFAGGVALLDLSSMTVRARVPLGVLPGALALAPDGSRVYVAIQAVWVDTGYGAGFLPGRSVTVIDAATQRAAAVVDLGADGAAWFLQNTAAGLAVTADRATLYVAVPRLRAVLAADTSTHAVRRSVALAGLPGAVAASRTGATVRPYTLAASGDTGSATVLGGVAVANVLANDRLGGIVPTSAHVTVRTRASSHPGLVLNGRTGALRVVAGTPVGGHTLVYRLCDRSAPTNCADAEVTVQVTNPLPLVAADDDVSAYPGTPVALNVLTNDTLGGAAATPRSTRLSVVSASHPGLILNPATGVVSVAAGTPLGTHRLRYRLCELAAPPNCDAAVVRVAVTARVIVAADDTGSAPRTGGRAVASVLANDTLGGRPATAATVAVTLLQSSHPGLTLQGADGSVHVAPGTPAGTHTLAYRACERAQPGGCDDATVRVTVAPYVVDAVDDVARASSKRAGIALASVLSNDRFAGAPVTAAQLASNQLTLSLVSITPPNPQLRLDHSDGSVDVLGKTESRDHVLRYRLCEASSPANCDEAVVRLELSGGD